MQEPISFTPMALTPGVGTAAITGLFWLIPAVPILASGVIALLKQPRRKLASSLAIGSMVVSLLLSLVAFGHVLSGWMHGSAIRETIGLHLDPGRHSARRTRAGFSILLPPSCW